MSDDIDRIIEKTVPFYRSQTITYDELRAVAKAARRAAFQYAREAFNHMTVRDFDLLLDREAGEEE